MSSRETGPRRGPALALMLGFALLGANAAADTFDLTLLRFEQYLESLRQQAGIPGLSAAVLRQQRIVWERGFGFQNLEASIRAAPDTPYAVGDLTQTFAATLALQCVEEGALSLDDPMTGGGSLGTVLSHAADGGQSFSYDPSAFERIVPAIEECTGQSYTAALIERILDRTAMFETVPGRDVVRNAPDDVDSRRLEDFDRVLSRLAQAYRVDRRGRATPSALPSGGLGASTGLIATTRDLARYSAALDAGVLLGPRGLSLAWNSLVSREGRPLPAGMGWFQQLVDDERVIWHFGRVPDAYSALFLKVPNRGLTLILLANSDGLSQGFGLEDGDVTTSLFARLFLRLFV